MSLASSKCSRREALFWLASSAVTLPAWAAGAALPGDSIYQLRVPLTDQNGAPFELASGRGGPVLVSMFYSSCEMVCPMIFETIKLTVGALPVPERDRARVKIVMISFDPARDSVAVLKRTAEAHGCDSRWTLARTDDANVRKIAAVLGVQYRRLESGEFNHSSAIQLLDINGRIAAKSSTLGAVDRGLVKAIGRELAGSA